MPTRPPVHRPHFACEPAPAARHDALANAPALVRNPYDRNWEKLRAAFLAANPLCLFCLPRPAGIRIVAQGESACLL